MHWPRPVSILTKSRGIFQTRPRGIFTSPKDKSWSLHDCRLEAGFDTNDIIAVYFEVNL